MELTVCSKVCNECPFRGKSIPGWLGSHSLEDIKTAMDFEQLFSCHMQRGEDIEENKAKTESGEMNICRGFIAMSNKSCKMFGSNPYTGEELRRLQLLVRENPMTGDDDVMPHWDFEKHHSQFAK